MSDNTGTQALWPQMIRALAAVDEALGLPDDGCNSTAQTLDAIRQLRADLDEQCRLLGMGASREARLMAQLAESQARELRLREALGEAMEWNWMDDDAGEVTPAWVRGALTMPQDDSALREMIEAAKAEEREACAAFVENDCADNQMADQRELKEVAGAIRARGDK